MNVAAFFDIDGTLVPPPTLEKRFLCYLRWCGAIGWKNYAQCMAPLLREATRGIFTEHWSGFDCAVAQCKAHFAGLPAAAMDAWLAWIARNPIECVPEALLRMGWHARQRHRIFMLSGTLLPFAAALAQLIPVPVQVCATELESEDGCYTGRVNGEAICGPAKARAMERLAAEFSLDLSQSYAYGDSFADLWMLARVGHPAVVQVTGSFSWRLAQFARRRGWPVLRWGALNNEARKIQREGVGFAEERREAPAIIRAEVKSR